MYGSVVAKPRNVRTDFRRFDSIRTIYSFRILSENRSETIISEKTFRTFRPLVFAKSMVHKVITVI